MRVFKIAALSSVAAIAVGTHPALAQDAPAKAPAEEASAGGLAEIVVTAERRSESLQRTALAVSAVTGDDLAKLGVTDAAGIGRLVPALQVTPSGGNTSFNLRGVGTLAGNSFAENAVSFNFNGVFVSRPTGPAGVFYDLQRVEVVKGPQGTLYGRNATGGAINVLPSKPVLGELSGNIMLEGGNYNARKGVGAINIPLGSTVALRLATQIVDRDGFMSDGYDDERGEAARASLLIQPSSDWSFLLVGDYFNQHGKGQGEALIPTATFAAPALDRRIGGSDPLSIAAINAYAATIQAPPFCGGLGGFVRSGCIITPGSDGFQSNRNWGVSGTVEGNLGFGKLTVIPAYRRTEADFRTYLPGFLGRITDNSDQMSLEVRLSSNSDQRLRYVLGLFYFNEQQAADNYFAQGNLSTTRFTPRLKTESKAAFGQLTYDVTPTLRLVAGGRYTKENKSQVTSSISGGLPGVINPPLGPSFRGDLTFEKFTWKAGVEWDAAPRSLVYANVATGFKTGGFFVASPPDNTFAPEQLTAYTLGTKNRFMGNKLQVNLEAFYWDYKNQQVTFVGGIRTGAGIFAQGGTTVNAGKSRIYGAELELLFAPTPADRFGANIQYLNGKYNSLLTANFSNTGAPIPTGCTVVGSRLANPGVNAARFYDTDCSGKPTVQSPKWIANLDYQHTFALGGDFALVAGARTSLSSSFFLNANFQENERQGAFMTSDAFLTLEGPGKTWSITGFVNNMEDKVIFARTGNRPVLNFSYATLRPPRTYGARVAYRF
ncbi:TonB-dependent receptor [Novosphingobium flavum]|uniref:TonB-dependent receptor n=1 Tax=Novosphingobium aerophilum TaxID=2839843 RepID=UPI00163AF1F8|nr:TonB-dependent receptor [Novosphingobium aerophilum]MBC2663519.1 TonB-dependent receptor [Novosphingobium aerophilum]